MNSDLLVNALIRDLRCDAFAVRPSDLLQVLNTRKVDLVIISADLNGRHELGVNLTEAAVSAHAKLPIVILLDHPDQATIVSAFRSGARGLFSLQESMSSLITCIEHVRNGYIWAGGGEADTVLEMFRNIPAPIALADGTSAALTKRESEVVRIAAAGKTNKAIASEMGLSEHTIKNYLFRAFEKLGVSSRVELLFYLMTRERSLGSVKPGRPAKPGSHLDGNAV
jgi:DNA-binding NarL/FixJ family response regulator